MLKDRQPHIRKPVSKWSQIIRIKTTSFWLSGWLFPGGALATGQLRQLRVVRTRSWTAPVSCHMHSCSSCAAHCVPPCTNLGSCLHKRRTTKPVPWGLPPTCPPMPHQLAFNLILSQATCIFMNHAFFKRIGIYKYIFRPYDLMRTLF